MIRLPKNLRLREPLLILILSILAGIFFAATHAYTQAYDRRRTELGQQWFDSALSELRSGRPNSAVDGFETALRYAPANWDYRLQLARALTAANRTGEARAYYQTLWQTNPDDGSVNLQLARLASQNGNREETERYFNGAVFGIWETDAEENRREALFEMIDFYLQENNYGAADSELTVLAANIPEDPNTHARVAALFLRVNDNVRAFAEFRDALFRDAKNPATLRGAAEAAFRLGRYRDSKSYLDSSLRFDPENQSARDLLATTDAILSLNPLESHISSDEKVQRIVRGFQTAGERLEACMMQLQATPSNPSSSGLGDLAEKWMMLSPMVQEPKLRNDADLSQQAMELTFSIEEQASTVCGPPPPGADMALLTIAQARPKDQ